MIHLGVLSRSEGVHRELREMCRQTADVSIELHLRSERELRATGSLDVLVVDLDSVSDLDELVGWVEPLPVVALGDDTTIDHVDEVAERLDGFGHLVTFEAERVIAAARAVATGLIVRDRAAAELPAAGDHATTPLTDRELEVLELVARGRSNAQIAANLGLSANTVKFHLSAVFGKLGASSRSEATWQAIQQGILSL